MPASAAATVQFEINKLCSVRVLHDHSETVASLERIRLENAFTVCTFCTLRRHVFETRIPSDGLGGTGRVLERIRLENAFTVCTLCTLRRHVSEARIPSDEPDGTGLVLERTRLENAFTVCTLCTLRRHVFETRFTLDGIPTFLKMFAALIP
jgi:hypothetical protein